MEFGLGWPKSKLRCFGHINYNSPSLTLLICSSNVELVNKLMNKFKKKLLFAPSEQI